MTQQTLGTSLTKHQPKPCVCGCGEMLEVHRYSNKDRKGFTYLVNDFKRGHGKRGVGGFNPLLHAPRLCLCGCGQMTTKFHGRFNRFIRGHENVGRVPWNKNGHFTEASKRKMSLSRIGKEPANKVHFDLENLRRLYLTERRTASEVCVILNVSLDAVKNRLRSLGWSRMTKDSCSLPQFKERMRRIRIGVMTSEKAVETPNKLERLVYNAFDETGVPYQKQAALFGKFVVDALFPQKKLVVEIFGKYWHERPEVKKKDFSKKKYLERCGYCVEELWDYEIKEVGARQLVQEVLNKYSLV